MKEFPKEIKFKYEWRRYQKRILDDLDNLLNDNHLHIIAPPGSGKTVLGLEVAVRLNKPTLILAPTIAIRNQWIQRFCELFLQVKGKPDWISENIKSPAFLTVVTYQGLHAAATNTVLNEELPINEEDEDEDENEERGNTTRIIDTGEIVKALKQQNIGTIVVDEAHHLKNEWWKSLNAVKSALNPTIVGLTATPPYDVSYSEWQRYIDMNGPVDAEITVPELVVENDLCPHQDYVYFTEPTENELADVKVMRSKAIKIQEDLLKDEALINAFTSHPIFLSPTTNLEWIYTNLEVYSSILIFLNATGIKVPETHLEVIGNRKFEIPKLSFEWMETALMFYLFGDKSNFSGYEEHKDKLILKLRRNGFIDRKAVCLKNNVRVNKLIMTSVSKLKSISDIVDIEHNSLNSGLRMVILTDYIRKELLEIENPANTTINKIGVFPIFEHLRRIYGSTPKLGILSGSLTVIPASAAKHLIAEAIKSGIEDVTCTPLQHDSDYLIVNPTEKLKATIVQLITKLFETGHIEVLVGTKSLLGEGWDAPAINSLILASFVGSYVLSNQMRGRAIRADIRNPEKTGNIWHLVCVDRSISEGGEDFLLLKRRFKAFVGVSNFENVSIENGIARLNLPDLADKELVKNNRTKVSAEAVKREHLKERWKRALNTGVILTEEIKVPSPEEIKNFHELKQLYYRKTIASLFAALGSTLTGYLIGIVDGLMKSARRIHSWEDLLRILTIIAIITALGFGFLTYKTFRIYVKYRDVTKDIQKIGEALLATLIKTGTIKSPYSLLTVKSSIDDFGAIYCHLEGGTTFEKSAFIKSLQEIMTVINNPRYLIIRKSTLMNVISQKDFHAVPELIGQNKKFAEYFRLQWSRLVGNCELVYTRTLEGRKVLLKSRVGSLASNFEDKTERINKWR